MRWRSSLSPTRVALVLGCVLGAVSGISVASHSTRPTAPDATLVVPLAEEAPVIDGELGERVWPSAARTGSFTAGDAPARPYSDARFIWQGGTLFIALYAADEDIRFTDAKHDDPLWTGDAFSVVLVDAHGVERSIDLSASGVVTDGTRAGGHFDPRWESQVRAAIDRDGTPNDPSDQDEEWIVELALPLGSLGLQGKAGERIGISLKRCDVLTGGAERPRRVCATWPATGTAQLVLGAK